MTKTEFMLIGSRQKLNTITDSRVVSTNGTPVNQVLTSKSLTFDHSDKISLLIANLNCKVATALRLEFVNNDTTPPYLLYTLLIKLQSLCSFMDTEKSRH